MPAVISRDSDRVRQQGGASDHPEEQGQVAAEVLVEKGLAGRLAAAPVDHRHGEHRDHGRHDQPGLQVAAAAGRHPGNERADGQNQRRQRCRRE